MAGKKRVPARMKAKHEFKPQGFTKKEWITMGIVALAIVLAVAGYLLLRDYFDGSLRVKDGAVQAEDNWIVANTGDTLKPKYFKLGSVSPVDGFTMENERYPSDDNVSNFVYKPTGDSALDSVSVMAAKGGAEAMAQQYATTYSTYLQSATAGEVREVTVGGRTGWGFTFDYAPTETEAAATATPAPEATIAPEATSAPAAKTVRSVIVYFDASRGMSVFASLTTKADDADKLPDTDSLFKALDPFVAGMTIDGVVQATAAPAETAASDAGATMAPAAAATPAA